MVTVLKHHGVKGMHWGVRRYQNPDGTLTSAGRKRMGYRKEFIKGYEKRSDSARTNIKNAEERQKLSDREYLNRFKKEIKSDAELEERPIKEIEDRWIKELRARDKQDIENSREFLKSQNTVIKNVKNTPINELSAAEVYKRTDMISKGAGAASALMGAAAGSVAGPAGAIGFGMTLGMMGTVAAGNAATKHYAKVGQKRKN